MTNDVINLTSDDAGIYANRVVVEYSQIEFPGAPSGETLLLMVHPARRFDLDALYIELEQINYEVQPDGSKRHMPFILEQKVRHHSWGADATSVDFVLQAAASGLIGSAAWEGLKAIAHGFAEKARALSQESPRTLSEDEAKFWAPIMTQRRFNLDEMPTVTKIEFSDPDATIWMTGPDGSKYVAQIELIEGLAALGKVSREYPPA
ncbi:hypothetical protein GS446_19710 [Rhodococcus hoagii]|nr:hypothetical protein [Prescottella equi]